MRVARGLERLGGRILDPQLLGQPGDAGEPGGRGRGAVEPRRDGVVRELRTIADDGARQTDVLQRAVGVDRHLDHDREAVRGLVERGEVGRELLRQHGEDAARGVDGRRVVGGVRIDRRVDGDEGVDVGHGDQDLHRPRRAIRRGRRGHRELVEVP